MAGEMFVQKHYSGDAAHGADYFTRASVGVIRFVDEHGVEQERPEQVLNTGIYVDQEGYIELGELTVRHMAHHLGMVDEWRALRSIAAYEQQAAELDKMSRQVQQLREENAALRQAIDAPAEVYVAGDGSRHASAIAAEDATRRAAGLPLRGGDAVRPISADEAPLPQGVPA